MRKQFAAWYPRTAEERTRFITEGLVAVDANVLLHLYRLTPDVRNDVVSLLNRLGERLWMPHQVGLEFHRNRFSVICEQEQIEDKIRSSITDALKSLQHTVNGMREHPAIDKSALRSVIDGSFEKIQNYLDTATSGSYLSAQTAMRSDEVLDAVTSLFENKVGDPYPQERIKQLENEAKKRFEQLIPPGYKDADKESGRGYGDYILWRQLLDEATKRKLPVLFVTNDQKEDWLRRVRGMNAGPRLELIEEMREEAGMDFHIQTLALFVNTAPESLRSPLKETTVNQVTRLDELDHTSSRAESASDLAVRSYRSTASQNYLQEVTSSRPDEGSETDINIARLQARRSELQKRLLELQAEMDANRKHAPQQNDESDPRSYRRAMQARIDATTELLAEATQRLVDLQSPT